jgi:hypothetical protein
MAFVPILALSLHVLAGAFWAGTSLTLARTGGVGGKLLFRPQMGSAVVAMLAGAYLWATFHVGIFGIAEQLLAAGVICAVVAAGVQGAIGGRALRRHARGQTDGAGLGFAMAQRIAAGLLAMTIVCMAAARYA